MMFSWLEDTFQDLHYAARTLSRSPGYTSIAVLIIALGVGVNTAVFSVVDRALLSPLPFDQPDDLYALYQKTPMTPRYSVSYQNFLDWQRQNQSFAEMAAGRAEDMVLSINGKGENLPASMISAELFRTLGVSAVVGRSFQPDDDRLGAGRVAMIDEDFWRERFGGSREIIGMALRLSGSAYTVVGIAPRTLHSLGRITGSARLYVPLGQWDEPSFRDRKVTTGMFVVARGKRGTTAPSVRADLARLAVNLAAAFPENRDIGITVEGLKETLVFRVRTTLLALLGGVGFVWLIVCADIANLAMVRSAGRVREFATRTALGAGVNRLARQLLAEGLLLALLGWTMGVGLSATVLRRTVTAVPADVPGTGDATLHFRVVAFAVVLSGLVVVISGLAPALHTLRGNLHEVVKDGTRASNRYGQIWQGALVAVQLALALVLLAGSALMIRSVANLWAAKSGFDPRNVLTFKVMPPPAVVAKPSNIRSWLRNLTARLKTLSGAEAVAAILDPLPLSGKGDVVQLKREGEMAVEGKQKQSAIWYFVGPEYFRALTIRLIRGRSFTEHDDERSPHVMLIDENLARAMFGDENPIGKRLDVDFQGLTEVVGVVGHVNHWNPGGDPAEFVTRQMYFPDTQLADRWMKLGVTGGISMVMRTRQDPLNIVEAVRARLGGDADQAIYGERSMDQILADWLATRRFLMTLLSIFAALALALACAGTYGVLSYAVGQRTREVAIRMALGAQRGDVLRLILAYGARLVFSGIAAGVAATLVLARLIASLLYGVQPGDPITLLIAALVLSAMAAVACFVPVRRAMRIDPQAALRSS